MSARLSELLGECKQLSTGFKINIFKIREAFMEQELVTLRKYFTNYADRRTSAMDLPNLTEKRRKAAFLEAAFH